MKIEVPSNVEYIIDKLIENGHEAYIVGGCVRDAILDKNPQDWDITTSAKPLEVKELFRRTIDTGIQHGTVTVMLEDQGYEVTTYRIDGEYEDNRRPKSVEFTPNLMEDLKRRDFTINAMAYNRKEGLIDCFHGLEDLKEGIIQCVGDANSRFEEDALRILRGVRFSAQLGFKIEDNTKKAIKEKVNLLKNISAERIRVELDKLLTSDNPNKLTDAYNLGITNIILPEFDQMMETKQNNLHHIYNVGIHSLKSVEYIQKSNLLENEMELTVSEKEKYFHILRWCMLLHDVGKPFTKSTSEDGYDHFHGHPEKGAVIGKEILQRLKFDNFTIDTVTKLIKWHDDDFLLTPVGVRKQMNKMGIEIMMLYFEMKKADIMSQNPDTHKEKLERLEMAYKLYQEILRKDECVNLKTLAVDGSDLIGIGYKPGIELGNTLNSLLSKVIEEPSLNEKIILLDLAKDIKK
ncbi:tRNA nucleotidyltransferase (CCA-adding enzyme) [Mobilisporobacter senegalensis]|uniref:tRNA nucleotidyltransferase (CCA-adding enzyme) n=1 Tax=Mobilisporobacter senegalensis TaxID=1329262 RepID=A0A3N1XA52_9FIRM|nr:CCA tRNA nucleotidyltransferase [Mobilisporobacter senegalensis]ROR23639.1 tRNA nucleotidyltransferase (CCA-adding enzyme) [Mobilisporobacter senegalensis]